MQKETWTIQDVLKWTSQKFVEKNFESPLLDAQILLEAVLCMSRVQLYMHHERPLSIEEREALRELVKRRLQGEPVAYIIGKKYWHNFELYVDKRVLIPRPETESLFDFVKKTATHFQWEPKLILDLCTGSGCLALALAQAYPNARVLAVDISQDALNVARQNFEKYNLTQVETLLGDVTKSSLFDYIRNQFGCCDVLVSNPPYLADTDFSWQDKLSFEPKIALSGGTTGIELAKILLENIEKSEFFSTNSMMLLELGENQPSELLRANFSREAEEVSKLMNCEDPLVVFPLSQKFAMKDLSGRERFLGRINGIA